ncbi:hypothetical protein KA005_55220, partial [bacterium]|nr:hypothetical protein [bacterium]
MAKKSGISWENIVAVALYLRDKGYIEMIPFGELGTTGIIGFQAKINAYGIDLVENSSKLETELPVTEVYINSKVQKIQQVIGAVSQTGDAHVDTVNYALIEKSISKMRFEAKKQIVDPVVLQNT